MIRGRVIAYYRLFLNGGRPPSWIWYDIIVDHPRFLFDDSNILLKLHVNRVYFARYRNFYIRPVLLGIAYSCPFWGRFRGILPLNEFR